MLQGSLSGRLAGREAMLVPSSTPCQWLMVRAQVQEVPGAHMDPQVSRKVHLPQGVLLSHVGVLSPWEMWGRHRRESGQCGSPQATGNGECGRERDPDFRGRLQRPSSGRHAAWGDWRPGLWAQQPPHHGGIGARPS